MKMTLDAGNVVIVLKKNLDKHQVELVEAMEVWAEKVHSALTELASAVDRDGIKAKSDGLMSLLHHRPKDVRSEYAKYIGLLERGIEAGNSTVDVDDEEYDQLFNDNWTWSRQASASNATYKKG